MTFKRIIVLLLLGLIFGAGVGVAYAYYQRTQRDAEQAALQIPTPGALTLVCSDGKTPRVLVTWDPKLTSAMSGLERSSDGTNWARVFTEQQEPVTSGYTDETVVANTQYYYRVQLRPGDVYLQAAVSTDPKSCQ